MTRKLDIKELLADPARRKALMVSTIIATQAREGIDTTVEQASAAYDAVQAERQPVTGGTDLSARNELFDRLYALPASAPFWCNAWMFSKPVFMQESQQGQDNTAFWHFVDSLPRKLVKHIESLPVANQ